jgi:hypothetical protein
VVELHSNGKSYGGEIGLLYKRKVDAFVPPPAEFEIPDLTLGCGLIKHGNRIDLKHDSARNFDYNNLFMILEVNKNYRRP